MSNARVLLLIAAFVTLTLGSFIWYIVTWDKTAKDSVVMLPSHQTIEMS